MQQGRSFYPVDDAAKADAQGRDYCGPLACPHGRTKTVLRRPADNAGAPGAEAQNGSERSWWRRVFGR